MKQFFFIILILLLTGCSISQPTETMPENNIFKSAVAGSFYPAKAEELKQTINQYLNNSKVQRLAPPQAIIVPHAGINYSGRTAAHAFKQIQGWDYKKIIVIAPSHYEVFTGAAVLDSDFYQTPLGNIKISGIVNDLVKNKLFNFNKSVYEPEHSLEIELPFLQTVLENFELIPVIISSSNTFSQTQAIADELKKYIDNQTLLVISTDFVHYGPNYGFVPFTEDKANNIKQIDEQAFSFIKDNNAEGFYNFVEESKVSIDGGTVIPVGLEIFNNSDIVNLDYKTSGELIDDYTNSVSYASFAFYEKTDLNFSQQQQDYLLDLAKKSIVAAVNKTAMPEIDSSSVDERLKLKQGVFVTLEQDEQLRGCIGYIPPYKPIYQAVMDNAVNAALEDHRFLPVKSNEIEKTTIEISILSVPKLLQGDSHEDKIDKLTPGVDGLVLQKGTQQATYLPQVWEDLPEPEEFLNSLCDKAGLASDAWKDSDTLWYVYQAKHFK